MDYTTPPKIKAVLGVLAIAITLSGYMLGDVNSGFILGGFIPIVFLAAWTRRDLRQSILFWLLFTGWIVVDIVLIVVAKPSLYLHPAILYAPLFIIDYVLVLGSFFILGSVLGRRVSS